MLVDIAKEAAQSQQPCRRRVLLGCVCGTWRVPGQTGSSCAGANGQSNWAPEHTDTHTVINMGTDKLQESGGGESSPYAWQR